jgi:hypothetical protein
MSGWQFSLSLTQVRERAGEREDGINQKNPALWRERRGGRRGSFEEIVGA